MMFVPGNLVLLESYQHSWTLCGRRDGSSNDLVEYPILELTVSRLQKVYDNFEGKYGLIVRIDKNHLEQATGYQVMISNKVWFCKSVTADKYFSLVERKDDKNRNPGLF